MPASHEIIIESISPTPAFAITGIPKARASSIFVGDAPIIESGDSAKRD